MGRSRESIETSEHKDTRGGRMVGRGWKGGEVESRCNVRKGVKGESRPRPRREEDDEEEKESDEGGGKGGGGGRRRAARDQSTRDQVVEKARKDGSRGNKRVRCAGVGV